MDRVVRNFVYDSEYKKEWKSMSLKANLEIVDRPGIKQGLKINREIMGKSGSGLVSRNPAIFKHAIFNKPNPTRAVFVVSQMNNLNISYYAWIISSIPFLKLILIYPTRHYACFLQ